MRWPTVLAIVSATTVTTGCGRLLGFGSDDEEAAPNAEDAAVPSPDGSSSAEGGSAAEDGGVVRDAAADADAADVAVGSDGASCVPPGTCAVSVFACCSEMEDPSASLCAGLCGVDICCN